MEYINTLDTMTPEEAEDAVVTGSLTEIVEYRMNNISDYLFYGFNNLEKIVLPLARTSGREIAVNTKVTEINAAQLEEASYMAFEGLTSLRVLDFGVNITLNKTWFRTMAALDAIILRKANEIHYLKSTDMFTGTPIAAGAGYIYVPRNLIDDYESATNWSAYAGQFRAIQDYTVDGRIHGELDRAKLGL